MSVMVTGGSGYIGAHVVRVLRGRGEDVLVVDDLSTGAVHRIAGAPLLRLDLAAPDAVDLLRAAVREHRVDAAIHLAGDKRVDESMTRPVHYWRRNVGGLVSLVTALQAESVRAVVFSSSAAIYGAVDGAPVHEDVRPAPMNPYGETKLAGEQLLRAAQRAGGIDACCLRYFNVAGAAEPSLADTVPANLVPIVVARLQQGLRPRVFGTDLPTPDGSCVRDYIHVVDVAEAHLAVLDALRRGETSPVYNLGTGRGHSVLEVIEAVAARLGVAADPEPSPRRAGDPASVVADPSRIAVELGWRARFGLDEIVASAVDAPWAGVSSTASADRRSP